MTSPKVTRSLDTRTQSTGTSYTGRSSQIIGSQVSPTCDSGSLGFDSPGTRSQTIGTSSGRQSSDEEVQEEGLPQEATSKLCHRV